MDNSVVSQHIQNGFVFLIITDDKFISIARQSVPAEYFSSDITEQIIRLCYSYYDQFHKSPKDHLQDELVRVLETKPASEKELFIQYLEDITSMSPPDRKYITRRISDFVKARTFENAAIQFVRIVERGKFTEARELMHHALRAGIAEEETGLFYFQRKQPTYYNLEEDSIIIPTGIPMLDKKIKGLRKGQFVCLLGGYKGKKTWFCMHLVRQALLQGMRVLHISHEMSLPEIELRYDMMFGGYVSERGISNVTITKIDNKGIERDKEIIQVESVYDLKSFTKSMKTMKRFGGKLVIKKYPMGTCTIGELDRYLDYLETFENYKPDIILNDYIDIMHLPLGDSAATRDRINQAYIEHKRIADERNILVITPSQSTREALQKSQVSKKDFAEDIRKLGNVDIALGISQDKEEATKQVMRVWVLGGRTIRDNCGCMFKMNLDIGQVCTDSWEIPAS